MRDDLKKARRVTDDSLRVEREHAGDQLGERSTVGGETADDVIQRARDRARLVLERPANEACISVKDTGPGIPAGQLDTVFERFSRLDKRAHGHGGHGLGLYIARAIVEEHSGRIWVESKLGEGSTFHVRLPANWT